MAHWERSSSKLASEPQKRWHDHRRQLGHTVRLKACIASSCTPPTRCWKTTAHALSHGPLIRNIDLENGRSFLLWVFKEENFATRTFLVLSGGTAESAECGSAMYLRAKRDVRTFSTKPRTTVHDAMAPMLYRGLLSS